MFKELTVVELTHDIKEHKLKEGDTGTVVLVYKDGKAYEIEFVESDGRTRALLTLMPEEIRPYINKDEYSSRWLNLSSSRGTVSGIILDTSVGSNEVRIGIETPKSKTDKEECQYPIATL